MAEQAFIRAKAVRWLADEPIPGLVEVEFADADDQRWRFVDKAPIFDREARLTSTASYPMEVDLACTIVDRTADRVVVSTAEPWGIESVDGRSSFVVRADQLISGAPR
jgi:hypothetical protein